MASPGTSERPMGSIGWFSQYTRGQWPKSPAWYFSIIWAMPRFVRIREEKCHSFWSLLVPFNWVLKIFSTIYKIQFIVTVSKLINWSYSSTQWCGSLNGSAKASLRFRKRIRIQGNYTDLTVFTDPDPSEKKSDLFIILCNKFTWKFSDCLVFTVLILTK